MISHGTMHAYNVHRCRCDVCRATARARWKLQNERRARGIKIGRPGPKRQRTYPLDALLRHAGTTRLHVAEYLEVAVETVYRWQRDGIPEPAADRAAIAYGTHPGIVWPEWWDVPLEEPG